MSAITTVEPTAESGGLLQVIARAVADPNMDVEKAERLFALQRDILADQAKREFNAAFRAAKSQMRPVVKNRDNDQTKSRYADLEAVSAAIDPIIDQNGFALTWGTGTPEKPGCYRITADLLHDGGHERHYFADIPEDTAGIKGSQNKTATHGFGSSMSYGRRYLKLLIFDIATTDDDDGQRAGSLPVEEINAAECAELRRLIAAADTTEKALLERLRFDATLPELPAARFEQVKGLLMRRIESARSEDGK